MFGRRAGLLLHPSSLPGPFGIGDLGPEADSFLDWAASAGVSIWQVLPLGPTGNTNSPYNSLSAFAGNPLLLSPERLREDGLLPASSLEAAPVFPPGRVDYGRAIEWKGPLLRKAWETFRRSEDRELRQEYERFTADPSRAGWLEDWCLFSALKERYWGIAWTEWPREIRRRQPEGLAAARRDLADETEYPRFLQFLFDRQWQRLRTEAARRGIRLLGDVPIYVALDSADVWSRSDLFDIDPDGRPRRVAGVPPDYFSETGQLWGNPLYRWDRIAGEGYGWWVGRIREALRACDFLRLDHFRGFAGYWEVPAEETTAVNGSWVKGPGADLFRAIGEVVGGLPFVAEDLGLITEDVRELLRALGLPGMKVLQFGLADPASDHNPARIGPDSIVYTGTHDNDTAEGWFASLPEEERVRVRGALPVEGDGVAWGMIRAAFRCGADLAVVPAQDLLGLGSAARMNDPRQAQGNWKWRLEPGALDGALAGRLRGIAAATGRIPPA
jgi:4-alpha-glucanotransferase